MRTTTIVGQLDLSDSLGTMLDCLQDETVEGALGDYLYAWKNGQQILIGTRQQGALLEESVLETTAFVFMSKDEGRQHRRPATWKELRASLAEGWVVGTDKKPGVKAWYPNTGRSIRRQMQDIYVFREPTTVVGGDSIRIGSISNNTGAVAVGRGARATVINEIVQGLGRLQTQHEAAVRNFLDYYVGASDSPEPFGGREPNLAAYTRWLDDLAAPAYALLTAPAGMGKSAALAHWVVQIQQRHDIAMVFFPISERAQTNAKSVVFSALYARVAHLHGDPPTRLFSAEEYRSAFQDYLARPLPDGRRLLVVLDGLDEAADWEVGAGLFPSHAPPHLKVLVAARDLAGSYNWAQYLGWMPGRDTAVWALDKLSLAATRDILEQMGDPLARYGARIDIITKLHELAGSGDPLLLGLYFKVLRADEGISPDLRPEDLLHFRPGLAAFFDEWLAHQSNLWGNQHDPVDRQAVDTVINGLATAYGALSAEDFCQLVPEQFASTRAVHRAAAALRRFLIGAGLSGDGYRFTHHRLREHFRDALSRRELAEWHRRQRSYGARVLADLNSGSLPPAESSSYVVHHYRQHLQIEPVSVDALCDLMSLGWLQAWRTIEQTETGFLDDVRAAMDCVAADSPDRVGLLVRGILCFSSVASRNASVPGYLLVRAVQSGALDLKTALLLVQSKPDPGERAQALVEVSEVADVGAKTQILAEALEITRTIKNESKRADVLVEIAKRLPPDEHSLANSTLQLARTIKGGGALVLVLAEVVKKLPLDAFGPSTDALQTARDTADYESRFHALVTVAHRQTPDKARDIYAEAIQVARTIPDEWERVYLLAVLAERVHHVDRGLLADVIQVARSIPQAWLRATAMAMAAKFLPPEQARAAVVDSLNAANTVRDDILRSYALANVARRLPLDEARDVLAEIRSVTLRLTSVAPIERIIAKLAERMPPEIDPTRATVILSIVLEAATSSAEHWTRTDFSEQAKPVADHLSTVEDPIALNKELAGAFQIKDNRAVALALAALAKHRPGQESAVVSVDALAAVRKIQSEMEKAWTLVEITEQHAPHSRAFLADALQLAYTIQDEEDRAKALAAIAAHLAPEEAQAVLTDALNAVDTLDEVDDYAWALVAVVKHIPPDNQVLLTEVLQAARKIHDAFYGPLAVMAVAKRLPAEQARAVLAEALQVTDMLQDDELRAKLLAAASQALPAESARAALTEALAVARGVRKTHRRAAFLAEVAEFLPSDVPSLLSEALDIVRNIDDDRDLASALAAVVKRLSPDAGVLLADALQTAGTITDEYHRVLALTAVAERLSPKEAHAVLAEALQVANAIQDDDRLTHSLAEIARQLGPAMTDLVVKVWDMMPRIDENRLSMSRLVEALSSHWQHIADHENTTLHQLLVGILNSLKFIPRSVAMSVIIALLPVITEVGGAPAINDTYRAIRDTSLWWP